MAVERFNLAFAGPKTHAGSPAITDRSGIQTLMKTVQEIAEELGIKSRHLLVLNALSGFVREFTSDNRPVVFASNQALSRRCCAMPIPTLQRVLRQLVELGLIRRNLSPNGKRYTHRDVDGQIVEAYGIDLGPLIERYDEFHALLREHQARAVRIALLRDRLSLCRQSYDEGSQEHQLIKAALRRKSKCEGDLLALLHMLESSADLQDGGTEVNSRVPLPVHMMPAPSPASCGGSQLRKSCLSAVMTSDAPQNDTHHQSSNPSIYESEEPAEKPGAEAGGGDQDMAMTVDPVEVAEICNEAIQFTQDKPESWRDLIGLALHLAPMIGIGDGLLQRSITRLGPEGFALTILCLVQRFGRIRNPAAYLTRLLAPHGQAYSPARFFRSLAASQRQSAST